MTGRTEILNQINKSICCLDAHSHAGGIDMYNYQHGRLHMTQSVRDLALKMSLAGVNYFIVYPLASSTFTNTQTQTNTGIDRFPYELSNRALLYEVSLFGKNAIVFPAIHPAKKVKEQLKFLEKAASDDLISGLKFHPLATHSTISDLARSDIIRFANDRHLPITIHSSDFDRYSNPNGVFALLANNPDLRVNVAHCGFFDREFYERAGEFEHLYVDSSSFSVLCKIFGNRGRGNKVRLNWGRPKEALQELFEMIPDKLMWGTDEPWTCYTDYTGKLIADGDIFREKKLLDSLKKQTRDRISYHNTLAFLQGGKNG